MSEPKARLMLVYPKDVRPIIEALGEVSSGACAHLIDEEFAFTTLAAFSDMWFVMMQHPEVPNKTPEHYRMIMQDLKNGFELFMDLQYQKLIKQHGAQ